MPSSLNGFPTQGLDPVAPVDSAMQSLISTGEHVLLGGIVAIVVDPKDDADLCREVRLAAARAGKNHSPNGCRTVPPSSIRSRGAKSEIADKALAGETFIEPHYLRQAQRYVGHAVRALRAAGVEVSIASLVEQLTPERLEKLLRDLPDEVGAAGLAYLDTLTPRRPSDLSGMRDRLALVAESDAGRWLDPRMSGAPSFDLQGALGGLGLGVRR